MKNTMRVSLAVLVVLLSLSWMASSQEPKNNMAAGTSHAARSHEGQRVSRHEQRKNPPS